jgi:hypothetical protein
MGGAGQHKPGDDVTGGETSPVSPQRPTRWVRWRTRQGRRIETAMIAVAVCAVVAPGTVYAVDTFTNVAIQDPTSGKKAVVNGDSRLNVDALSSNVTLHYKITGTGKQSQSLAPVGLDRLLITSIVISNGGLSREVFDFNIYLGNCFGASGLCDLFTHRFTVGSNVTVPVEFPTGLVWNDLCVCSNPIVIELNSLTDPLGQVDVTITGRNLDANTG